MTGVVNHLATYVSLWAADEFGRRVLFIEGGVQMSFALVRAAVAACAILQQLRFGEPEVANKLIGSGGARSRHSLQMI